MIDKEKQQKIDAISDMFKSILEKETLSSAVNKVYNTDLEYLKEVVMLVHEAGLYSLNKEFSMLATMLMHAIMHKESREEFEKFMQKIQELEDQHNEYHFC